MVTRFRTALRTILPLCLLVLFCSVLAPAPAQARAIYKISSRLEGDPGDGVLSTGDDEDIANRLSSADTKPVSVFTASPAPGALCFVPIYLPGNLLPGYIGGFQVPQGWSRMTALFCRVEGRDRHAP